MNSDVLNRRKVSFNAIIFDFTYYNPDTRNQLRGYLPKRNNFAPAIHETVALLYKKMADSARNNTPDERHDYEQFESFKIKVIEYVKFKQNSSQCAQFKYLDIWAKAFCLAPTQEVALLHVSDQIQDFLWLLVNSPRHLGENRHLSEEIEKLSNQISNHCILIKDMTSEQQTKIENVIKEIQVNSLNKEFSFIKEKSKELKKLIHVKKG